MAVDLYKLKANLIAELEKKKKEVVEIEVKLKEIDQKISESNKKWKCECGLAFKFKRGLDEHVKNKHSEKNDNICSFCSLSFSSKSNLSKHIRNVHCLSKFLEPLGLQSKTNEIKNNENEFKQCFVEPPPDDPNLKDFFELEKKMLKYFRFASVIFFSLKNTYVN